MRRVLRVVLVGAVIAAVGGAVLAAKLPKIAEHLDASDLKPGLLQVERSLGGSVSLGNGVYVQFTPGGLLITRLGSVVFRGVDHGSPFTAGLGHLEWRGGDVETTDGWAAHDGPAWQVREVVEHSLGNLTITGRTLAQRGTGASSSVRYSGRVFAGDVNGKYSRPFSLTITRRARDSRVLLDVRVPGADVVAMHAFRRDGYVFRGGGAQHGELLLRNGRYPIVTRSTDVRADEGASLAPVPVLFSSASNGFALDSRAYSVLDLRHGGRVDAEVWEPRMQVRLYDGSPIEMVSQHSFDAALMHRLPVWATAGAIVSVRGSPQQVRDAVDRLVGARAAVAAVLVADGGQRARYPRWHALVDRLASKDVRVLTSVSPSLALAPRPGGPDDEPRLLATARAKGYLVTSADGGPLQVRTADPDVGSVPGALIDLTNPDAVRWYTTVLADRMSRERLSGWQVLGGAGLPPTATLLHGDAATQHNAWPRRWAAIPRQACIQAGRPDCLLLQATADERTPASVGSFGLGRQATDWTERGLGGVLAATVNAGLSGLTITHSAVGGAVTLSNWWGRDRPRTDELLARWTELETFGPLLVTADGDHPGDQPQVWDSPSRLAAFARMSRVYAALADYRRTAVTKANRDGIPVVRPVWLSDPGLTQPATDSEYFFGDSLLVVPVVGPGVRHVTANLPPGRWIELFTGTEHLIGPPLPAPTSASATATDIATPQQIDLDAPLGQPVVLYRARDRAGAQARQALANAGLLPPAG